MTAHQTRRADGSIDADRPADTPDPARAAQAESIPLCDEGDDGGEREWDALDRLLLLLEIVEGPPWLRAAARRPEPGGGAG